MLPSWVVGLSAVGYIGLLFAVASFGDRERRRQLSRRGRPTIYALSLAIYCTSWTFFGSVGLAAVSGFEFLTIYIGPIIMVGLLFPLVLRVVRLAKAERITSVADFIAARYGKSAVVAQLATIIAVVGTLPYIALQLKAVSGSVITLVGPMEAELAPSFFGDIALMVALSMALFAILFGTRHADATEHQEGLMLAIATESVVKLVAFLAVGFFIVFVFFDGPADLLAKAAAVPAALKPFARGFTVDSWLAMTFLSLCAIVFLPRQFHVMVVENNSEAELRRARWLFPLYLVGINLFVVPITIAGIVAFGTTVDADTFVVALPQAAGNSFFTLAAFIGGLSAATAMVIVECVALSIMISNNIVVPLVLRHRAEAIERVSDAAHRLLLIRRAAIVVVMLLAYAYYRATGGAAALASIGLLSFAAVAQFAPAFFGGLVWRGATARGAFAGLLTGIVVWFYTLLLPALVQSGLLPAAVVHDGLFSLSYLRPQALFGIELAPLAHGVLWSLVLNTAAFVLFSLLRRPEPIERLQAGIFVPQELVQTPVTRRLWRTAVTVGDLMHTAARYVGADRAERAYRRFAEERSLVLDRHRPADIHVLRFTEQLLTSAIGASSSRLVLSLLMKRSDPSAKGAFKLLDDASAAIQYNRDLLQTALDQVTQGIAVFDRDLRLVCWNRQFRTQLGLPDEFGEVGTKLDAIIRHGAALGDVAGNQVEALVADRIGRMARCETFRELLKPHGMVLEVRSSPMPDGGIVATYTDITERVETEETLEFRVRERTEELTRVNDALTRAKAVAEEANIGKTRFLAGAGHDILQPLNAARLYATSLVEQTGSDPIGGIARNIDASLEAVEEIIGAVLDISRLDSGALKPEIGVFRLDEVLRVVEVEFVPLAKDKGLDLRVLPSRLAVRSDRRLLRRLLENLVSNAIKYSREGKVLVGCRRRGARVELSVYDTGIGIPASKHRLIFEEFQRLDNVASAERGLGLGLSIVERISRVLGHEVGLTSAPGKGSHFAVSLPLAEPEGLPEPAVEPAPAIAGVAGTLVLCIDNEPQILSGLTTLLAGWGCGVITARSAAEAEAALIAAPRLPDISIVDYHLDEGDGVAAVRALRARFGPDLPAILMTADRSPQAKAAAESAAMPLLHKPVRPAALRAVIVRWRARPRIAAE